MRVVGQPGSINSNNAVARQVMINTTGAAEQQNSSAAVAGLSSQAGAPLFNLSQSMMPSSSLVATHFGNYHEPATGEVAQAGENSS